MIGTIGMSEIIAVIEMNGARGMNWVMGIVEVTGLIGMRGMIEVIGVTGTIGAISWHGFSMRWVLMRWVQRTTMPKTHSNLWR